MSYGGSEKRLIQPPGVAVPTQPYTPVIRVGNLVFVAGQVAYDGDRRVVGLGDPRAQAEQCWRNIVTCLSAAEATLEDVVKIVAYFADIRYAEHEIAVRRSLFAGGNYPVATIMEVKLGRTDLLMEIDVFAVVAGDSPSRIN